MKISTVAALVFFAGALPVAAQSPDGPPPAASTAPVPHGLGSLAGVWRMTGYKGSANSTARQRIATDSDGKIPPLLPWAKKLLEQRITDADNGKLFVNTAAQCLPQGTPYMLFGAVEGPIQIFEEQNQVTMISFEENEDWFIYLNQNHPSPVSDIAPSYHGDSVAHWDGDTLVVDSVAITTKTTLDQVGMPHSDALHVITKIKRIAADQLQFLITIDDPKTFSAPWTRKIIYRLAKPGEHVDEYVCDNNRNGSDAKGFQSFNF